MREFERNTRGHIVISFIALGLSGEEEIARSLSAGRRISTPAKECLRNTLESGYDSAHRLVAERRYRVALVPGGEISALEERTSARMRALGMKEYGYGEPRAGLTPRIIEAVSYEAMRELGVWSINCLHAPIGDRDRDRLVLRVNCNIIEQWLGTCFGEPRQVWEDPRELFAFPEL